MHPPLIKLCMSFSLTRLSEILLPTALRHAIAMRFKPFSYMVLLTNPTFDKWLQLRLWCFLLYHLVKVQIIYQSNAYIRFPLVFYIIVPPACYLRIQILYQVLLSRHKQTSPVQIWLYRCFHLLHRLLARILVDFLKPVPLSGFCCHMSVMHSKKIKFSPLYYYNVPSLATRLTADYLNQTFTGKLIAAFRTHDLHRTIKGNVPVNPSTFRQFLKSIPIFSGNCSVPSQSPPRHAHNLQ